MHVPGAAHFGMLQVQSHVITLLVYEIQEDASSKIVAPSVFLYLYSE